MKFPRLTGSRLQLADACPGSHALPWTKDTSAAAERGTSGHEFMERALTGDVTGALEVAPPEMRGRLTAVDIERLRELFDEPPHMEETFAYDLTTGEARSLGTSLGRDYSAAKDTEIVLTVDAWQGDVFGGRVYDWKFGRSFITGPRENWQVRAGAAAIARYTGAAEMRGGIVKVGEDGRLMVLVEDFGDMDLDGIEADLRRLADRVNAARLQVQAGQEPPLVLGDHCTFCPARWNCPAQARAGQALIGLATRGEALTPEKAGEAWVLMRAVRAAVEMMESTLREMAAETPIPLPNGKVLRPVESKIDVLDAVVAFGKAASDEEAAAVLRAASVTKEGLKRELGEEKASDLLARMKAAGGVHQGKRVQMRECNPPAEKSA